MSLVINAIFENGVFKPLNDVHIKEHEQVEIKILSADRWESRFDRLIERIQKKAIQYTSEEIDADITMAVKESREARYDH